jgi:hypothetical protein
MGKRHRWGGMIADAKDYVWLSAGATSGNWERRRRAVKAAGGGGVGDNGVVIVKDRQYFSSYLTCIVFLSKKSRNLLATC